MSAAASAVVAFLGKAIINHLLSLDIEKYRYELKHEADIGIEQLKSRLQITAQERQIVFSKLHERRALIIAECYALLDDAYSAAYRFGGHMVFGGLRTQKPVAEEAYNKCLELSLYFRKHKIFFSGELCSVMNEFVELIAEITLEFHYAADDPKENKEFREKFESMLPKLMDRVPELKNLMEKDFRNLLGVSDSNLSHFTLESNNKSLKVTARPS